MKKQDPFKYFKQQVQYWVKFFGLYNWDVNIHKDEDAVQDSLAYTATIVDNKRADIYLVLDWDGAEMTRYELKTAFHEVLEVMLAEIRYLAGKRDIRFEEIDSTIHNIIRILTAKIFEGENNDMYAL